MPISTSHGSCNCTNTKKKCGFVPQLPTIIFNCTEQRRTKRGSVLDIKKKCSASAITFCRGFYRRWWRCRMVKNCVRFVNICTTTWLFSNYETKADYTGNDFVVCFNNGFMWLVSAWNYRCLYLSIFAILIRGYGEQTLRTMHKTEALIYYYRLYLRSKMNLYGALLIDRNHLVQTRYRQAVILRQSRLVRANFKIIFFFCVGLTKLLMIFMGETCAQYDRKWLIGIFEVRHREAMFVRWCKIIIDLCRWVFSIWIRV